MKHLKPFEGFDDYLTEKIKWQHLLLALGLYHGAKDLKTAKSINHIYQVVNSPKSDPTESEKKTFDAIRKQMIESVRNSDRFQRFNKEWVIDSLKNIKVKVLDSIDLEGSNPKSTLGAYFYIKPYNDKWISKPIGWIHGESDDNLVFIKREILDDKDLDEILIHELYHYLDRLMSYPDETKRLYFFDKKAFKDDKYTLNKLARIMMANQRNYDTLSNDMKRQIKYLYDDWKSKKSYYQEPGELFARWNTLKSDMLKDGCLKDINQCPTKKDIYEFLFTRRRVDAQYLPLLLVLDWDRLEEFNRIM